MIISKTPYRLSLFGGGADYPSWFVSNETKLISAAMANYCYISVKQLPPYFDYVNRVIYYKIDSGILVQMGDVEISNIVKYIKDKDFGAIRKWVATTEIDAATLYRKLYDGLYDVLKPQSIPQAVIIIADYQYKQAFVADPEINTVACLTELMVSVEFK
jgi:hypothetical protein